MLDIHVVRKYFFLALFAGAMLVTVLMLWPFGKVLIASIVVSVIFHPLYVWIKTKVTPIEWLASLLTTLCFVMLLCVPLFFIGSIVINQSQYLYSWVVEQGGLNNILNGLAIKIETIAPNSSLDIKTAVADLIGSITSNVGRMFAGTLNTVFSVLLVMLSMFYFLKDGMRWKETVLKLSPLTDASDQKIITKLRVAMNGIVKGYLVIAAIQGVLMGVGLAIFGVPNAALWGVLAGIASLVPTIGTALVAVPAIIFLFATGNQSAGIGFAIWSAIIVGTVDNLLNPLIVGKTIEIHPLLILFAVLGGIALMGPIGILIGPLVISFIYALVSVYKSEMA